jgi:hypothetical protein
VISRTTEEFWSAYRRLPVEVRRLALKNYRLWREDSRHPSLQFKKVGKRVWSARVGDHFRAVAAPVEGGFVWFWIGSHADYDKLIVSF